MTSSHGIHAYHLVDIRPWPLTGSIRAIILTTGLVKWFHQFNIDLLVLGTLATVLTIIQWWRDITREGTYQGLHTRIVIKGLRWGIILFIVSEVLFFFSFFWAFFHRRLAPTVEIGICWPPLGIQPFNPFQIPLLNTTILLSSGATVTWAHHAIIESNHTQAIQRLALTVILGFYFTALQAFEYIEASFTIADSVYGSTFFVATGFHGLHVIIGSSFLTICWIRLYNCHFSSNHHFGFEAAAWYWHFVDVVWLFLYVFIYWWGGCFFNIISIVGFQPTSLKVLEKAIVIIISIILITILLATIVMMLASILSKKIIIDREKRSPYECGFDPKGSARLPFSLRFFLIAVIFLIFDVEITLLLPLASIIHITNIYSWLITGTIFLFILLFGLYYEWYQGALDWSD